MSKPIKAFLGKSYTKNGITKMYMYNPSTEKYGWYNVGDYATDMGRSLMNEYEEYAPRTFADETKAARLRENIKTVVESVSDDVNIDGMDELLDAIYDKVDSMSDYEIDVFSEYNKKSINLYFEYKDVNVEGLDARVIHIAKSLGINVYDYVESDKVPENVKSILTNINEVVRFNKEFEDLDLGVVTRSK